MDESLVAQYPNLERDHFWWATRRRLVRDLVANLGGRESRSVLDVGCGSGMTSAALAADGASVTGVDLEIHGDPARWEGVQLVAGDYLSLASELGRHDVVVALDAVEHFQDEAGVVKRLAENLVPGGHLIVTVPAYRMLWSSHDETNRHYRRYTKKQLRQALENADLEVERIGYLFMSLFLPKLTLSLLERFRGSEAATGTDVAGWANRVAARYFAYETALGQRFKGFWPLGTSVVAVARRPD